LFIAVGAGAFGLVGCGGGPVDDTETAASGQRPGSRAGFVDITAEAGIDFRHRAGLDGSYAMREVFGPGLAMFDHDNDGDLDLYFVGGAAPAGNRLYSREADGTYRDVTTGSGLGDTGYGMGVAIGDTDNDGDLDVYVSNVGPDRFYRNDGNGSFTDVTKAAGVGGDVWSTSVGFCDYDADGHLDWFVVHYVQYDPSRSCTDDAGRLEYCGPMAFRGTRDTLYRNLGNGTFRDVSVESGIAANMGKGLGLACADLDADGRLDFFVANDGESNFLWHNLGDGRFEDRAVMMGTAVNAFGKPEASMGVALGDADGDLKLDLFLTHLARESNTLYTRIGDGGFSDNTATAGVGPSGMPYTGFGTGFFDADHDGDLDLFVANGRVERGGAAPSATGNDDERFIADYGEPNLFYLNDGGGRFSPATDLAGDLCATRAVSRGAVFGDVDGDGDLDIVLANSNGGARLYRNDLPGKGHWLRVRAVDPALGRDAVGATLQVRAGEAEFVRPVTHTSSYLSSSDAEAHFGLGSAAVVDWIEVLWPDGTRERFAGSPADRLLTVFKGQGRSGSSR
jgi:hypothetical protein